ncbi:phosphonate C-P lyase system protein PhnG [Thiothrix subterranea]|uniref:Phosphonate C-P lyase system protein PhnG n=1 Tax=Thiothrix subterranea TaxID=2735563 RepID=A0AA51MI27_9GAMM|nr:phosphonate C-P lyase system protein PhnG [Thiothrix subterranea]MDQ5768716.1 phosphonate C-P lyase system protein PhnG [Thiothrix subterranea]WML84867.1 phosphonate C-P lyase system protein PhnG [Thiothrix subterranea]
MDKHHYEGRSVCLPALASLPAAEVIALAQRLAQSWQRRYLALPEQGLGMLQLQESTLHQAFYLGEFPVASAWVELTLPDGTQAQGAVHVMQDNAELAEALAVCDAIVSGQLPGAEAVAQAVAQGQVIRDQVQANRKTMLAKTHVNFSLLETTGENDD